MSSSADRQREHRRRQREGLAVIPVTVNLGEVADMLVESGLLEAWSSEDRDALAAALTRQIELLVEFSRRNA